MGEKKEYKLHMDIPSFSGPMHIDAFLDSIFEVEMFFDYLDIKESKKVKLEHYNISSS